MRDDESGLLTAEMGTPAEGPRSPRLLVVSASPLNAETRLAQQRSLLTPTAAFYVRNHFHAPWIDPHTWRLQVEGEVERPLALTFEEVLALPSRTLLVTLECAGNGRSALQPPPSGEPWGYGAVSSAEWTGTPLQSVLALAGLTASVCHVVIEGADRGYVADANQTLPFARSLPRRQALHPDTLLAYAMNGETLPPDHGFPLRLIVPGWYGMAAVKWVTRIHAQSFPFTGFYQRERYVMTPAAPDGSLGATPLTLMRPRSVISEPVAETLVPRGDHTIRGFAWSGASPIAHVAVSVDGGRVWERADLISRLDPYLWVQWEYPWRAQTPGPTALLSCAVDAGGNQQPAKPEWNRLGYANNAIQTVQVFVP